MPQPARRMLHGGGRSQHLRTMLLSSCSVAWADACNSPDKRSRADRTVAGSDKRGDRIVNGIAGPQAVHVVRSGALVHRQGKIGEPSVVSDAVDVHMCGVVGEGKIYEGHLLRKGVEGAGPAAIGRYDHPATAWRKDPLRRRSGNRSATDQRPACRVQAVAAERGVDINLVGRPRRKRQVTVHIEGAVRRGAGCDNSAGVDCRRTNRSDPGEARSRR